MIIRNNDQSATRPIDFEEVFTHADNIYINEPEESDVWDWGDID